MRGAVNDPFQAETVAVCGAANGILGLERRRRGRSRSWPTSDRCRLLYVVTTIFPPAGRRQGVFRISPVILPTHATHRGGHCVALLKSAVRRRHNLTHGFDTQNPRERHVRRVALMGEEFRPVQTKGLH
jgi:hypothetical protein